MLFLYWTKIIQGYFLASRKEQYFYGSLPAGQSSNWSENNFKKITQIISTDCCVHLERKIPLLDNRILNTGMLGLKENENLFFFDLWNASRLHYAARKTSY